MVTPLRPYRLVSVVDEIIIWRTAISCGLLPLLLVHCGLDAQNLGLIGHDDCGLLGWTHSITFEVAGGSLS